MMGKQELQALKEKLLGQAKELVDDVKKGAHDFFTLEIVIQTPEGEILGRSEMDLFTGDQVYEVPKKGEGIDWDLVRVLKEMNGESLALRTEIIKGFSKLLDIPKLAALV